MSIKKPDIKESEMVKLEKQFEAFDQSVKEATAAREPQVVEQSEMQTKLSSQEMAKSKEIYLKPIRRVGSKESFNEKFRADYDYKKEMVRFVAENKEVIGESVPVWTKPFAGIPAEEWIVPVNKPIWGPRYLAEQLQRKYYNRLTMKEDIVPGNQAGGDMYGKIVVDSIVHRLDAYPAPERTQFSARKSTF